MYKRILISIICLILGISLIGCSKNNTLELMHEKVLEDFYANVDRFIEYQPNGRIEVIQSNTEKFPIQKK